MEKKKQVIILGGGPAGSFTALHLVSKFPELAEDIILLEAQHQGRDKICAGGVSGRVMAKGRGDLGIDIASLQGRDVDGMDARFRNKTGSPDKIGLGKVIRRDLLDSWLLDRVKEKGVTVLTETPGRHVVRNSSGVSVETSKGTFNGRILVAADGVNGLTKRTFGLHSKGGHKEYLYFARIPDIQIPPRLLLDYTPILYGIPGYAWFFPEEKGANIGITGGAPNTMGFLKTMLFKMVEKNLGERLDEREVKLSVWPERFFSFSVPSRTDRILFVGDNLGVTPMTGEGLGICFDSAKAAAEEAILALGSGDFSFRGYPRRLLAADFVPTWLLEHTFLKWKSPRIFHLFFLLATTENRVKGETMMDRYCEVFDGESPATLFAGLEMVRRTLPSFSLLKKLAQGYRW